MMPYFSDDFFNPSSAYAPAVSVRRAYEQAKHDIAVLLGARDDNLVMTAGATESIALAFRAVTGGHVVTSAIEHQAVLAAASAVPHTIVAPTPLGVIDPAAVEAALKPETQLVSIGYVNSELGTIQPLSKVAAIIKRERHRRLEAGESMPLYFHSDVSQAAGLLEISIARLGVDMLTLGAGKIYGPKQIGLLYATPDVRLQPLITGGGQERGLRSGTENVAGVIGLAKAMQLAAKKRKREVERLGLLRDFLAQKLQAAFPEAVFSGHPKHRLKSFLNVSFPGLDGERLVFLFEAVGILVATGSACAANKGTRSHVLAAIGLDDAVIDGSLRMTFGALSTEETTERVAHLSSKIIQDEYARIQG